MKQYLYYYLTNEGEEGATWAKDFNDLCVEASTTDEAIMKAESLIGHHDHFACEPVDYDSDESAVRVGLLIEAGRMTI